jgi:hypothetical protein
MKIHSLRPFLCTVALGLVFATGSTYAALVTWNLNPSNANSAVGSASHTFMSSGFSLTAYGFDNVSGPDTPHELWFKDTDTPMDHGLGLTGTAHNELQVGPNGPLQYIQFDLTSLLALGFINGKLKVSSVDPGEAFDIYGSNALGQLGSKISLGGGPYGDTDNNTFVNIPSFGSFKFISVAAAIDDVLPWAFAAVIPEIGGSTAAFVLLAFFGVVLATRKIGARHNS